jgi:hypothetical protein
MQASYYIVRGVSRELASARFKSDFHLGDESENVVVDTRRCIDLKDDPQTPFFILT